MPLASKEHRHCKNVVRRGKEHREGWGRKKGRGEAYRLTAGLFLCGFYFSRDGGAAEGASLGESLIYKRLIYREKEKKQVWWRGEVMEMEEGGRYQCRHWESV